MADYITIFKTGDLAPGTSTTVEVKETKIALFNVGGSFYAIDNTCLHRSGPLGEGFLNDKTVTCPWHGWEYNVETGKCETNPNLCVKRYDVKLDGDNVKILLE